MRICVYASSSQQTSPAFVAQGRKLGRIIAEHGHVLINGGGKFGGMGALNEGCRAAGGKIECVIHEMFCVDEGEFEGSDELIICRGDDLGERKRALATRCDAIIVLPGGLGTIDEMFDAAALCQLGMKNARPVVAVNVDGYYDATFLQLERALQEGLLSKPPADVLASVPDVDAAILWCEQAGPVHGDRAHVRAKAHVRFASRASAVMMDVGEFLTTPAPSTKRFAGAFAAGVGVGAALALVLGRRK